MKLYPMIAALTLAFLLPSASATENAFDDARRATDDELDRMRGGFEVRLNGLPFNVSFSLDRLTYLNGELVAASRLSLESLTNAIRVALSGAATTGTPGGSLTPDVTGPPGATSSPPVAPVTGSTSPPVVVVPTVSPVQVESVVNAVNVFQQGLITVVQNGAGNQSLADNINSVATVIQNTLDNQVIANLTVVNARFSQAELEIAARLNAVNSYLIGR